MYFLRQEDTTIFEKYSTVKAYDLGPSPRQAQAKRCETVGGITYSSIYMISYGILSKKNSLLLSCTESLYY